jgi:hypothetical protein
MSFVLRFVSRRLQFTPAKVGGKSVSGTPSQQHTRSRLGRGVDLPPWTEAMISFSGSLKIFLLVDCCDMRKGFNGASTVFTLVSSSFGEDPRSGALRLY